MRAILLCSGIEKNLAKNGSDFLRFTFKNKEASCKVYCWDNINKMSQTIKKGHIYNIETTDEKFPVLISYSEDNSANINDFVTTAFKSDDEVEKCLSDMILSVEDSEIKQLLCDVFSNKDLKKKFILLPAAKRHHHNYRGGLLKHTYEVWKFCKNFAETNYTDLSTDVLYAGAILHDIGKINDYTFIDEEPEYAPTFYESSHLASGPVIIQHLMHHKIAKSKLHHIFHIINSHHFRQDWGAITEPKTKEALIVFYADYFSMVEEKMRKFRDEQDTGVMSGSGVRDVFLDFNKIYNS